MQKVSKFLVFLCLFSFFFNLINLKVDANSAQTWWLGTDATGAIITDEDSPIIVTSEDLTFDIDEFPLDNYGNDEAFNRYSARLSAKYHFLNTADYNVLAHLLFPFGRIPDYGYCSYGDPECRNQNYAIKINGQEIERKIRYTFLDEGRNFFLKSDLDLLSDTYLEDAFFNPDLKVKELVFKAETNDKAVDLTLDLDFNADKTKIILEDTNGYNYESNIVTRSFCDEPFSLFVFGDDFNNYNWTVYADGRHEEKLDTEVKLQTIHEYTLEDYIFKDYSEDHKVSRNDYYNAMVSMFKYQEYSGILDEDGFVNLDNNLMAWYEYEIDLKPNEEIINEVIAPIYPSIDYGYSDPVYEYTYLLSPAKSWHEFHNLNIQIHTPFKLVHSSLEGFKETSEGYEYFSEELPEGELEFTLSISSNPEYASSTSIYSYILMFIALILIIFTGIIIRKRKK